MQLKKIIEYRNKLIIEACRINYPCIIIHGDDDFREVIYSLDINIPAMKQNILFFQNDLDHVVKTKNSSSQVN